MSTNQLDTRLTNISYSSLLTLHRCPREFQIQRMQNKREELTEEEKNSSNSITLTYGTVIGDGIQDLLVGLTYEEVVFKTFLKWNPDIFSIDEKRNKSIWSALFALDIFSNLRKNGFLDEWEVVIYKGKPATELSFRITFPDGFKFRGHVDVVLVNKKTGKLMVLELKTTAMTNVNPALYKHSSQAIGYSIVLDAIAPEASSYQVLYLVLESKTNNFIPFEFPKSYYERARWIRELHSDTELLTYYSQKDLFPMRGESCLRFNRECDYYGVCTLSDDRLFNKANDENQVNSDKTIYDIEISLQDLIDSQSKKELKNVSSNTTAANSVSRIDTDNIL